MKVLIVHAHHEPKSFSSALSKRAEEVLLAMGHEVEFSDLYKMNFEPISDRRNFESVKNPDYLKQQQEELHASEIGGFSKDVESEIQKLENCDLIIFSFPLWWFGMPAILKGWCDKVLAMGRVYGGGKLYENGVGKAKKRGMIITTTGGGADTYNGWGFNPALDTLLLSIQHGIFWFNGFLPLEPFVAWSPARISNEERTDYLQSLEERLFEIFDEKPFYLPLMADFKSGQDERQRYRVVINRKKPVDENYMSLAKAELEKIEEMKKDGTLLDFEIAASDDANWKAFILLRVRNEEEAWKLLQQLPLAEYFGFDLTRIVPAPTFRSLAPTAIA